MKLVVLLSLVVTQIAWAGCELGGCGHDDTSPAPAPAVSPALLSPALLAAVTVCNKHMRIGYPGTGLQWEPGFEQCERIQAAYLEILARQNAEQANEDRAVIERAIRELNGAAG